MKTGKMTVVRVLGILMGLCFLSGGSCQDFGGSKSKENLQARVFTLTNGVTAVDFTTNGPNGSPRIAAVRDPGNPLRKFPFQTGTPEADLWQIELYEGIPNKPPLLLNPSTALPGFSVVVTPNVPSSSAYTVEWRGMSHPDHPGESVDVSAFFYTTGQTARMHLQVNGSNPDNVAPLTNLSLFAVEFPRMVIDRPAGSKETLSMPVVGGWLMSNPSTDPAFAEWSGHPHLVNYPGYLSMQWFSYYDAAPAKTGSLFFGTLDPDGYRKEFIVRPSPGSPGLRNSQRHLLANATTAKDFPMNYPYALGIVGEDWYDGAKYYRDWAKSAQFVPQAMHSNPDFSPIIGNASVFGTFGVPTCPEIPEKFEHANFAHWQRDINEQVSVFKAGDIPALVYNWDESCYDLSLYGKWLPVRPQFANESVNLKNAGQPFSPYFLNHKYSDKAPFYSQFKPARTRKLNGEPHGLPGIVPDRSGDCSIAPWPTMQTSYRLCQAEAVTRQYPLDYANLLAESYGATGIYLDVFTNLDHIPCYDFSHNHPAGGGNWESTARRSLVDQLRADVRQNHNSEFYTYSESQHELFLKQFELVFEHATWELIGPLPVTRAPIFESVYHDYQLTSNVLTPNMPTGYYTNTPATHDWGRFYYSMRSHFGGVPFAGSLLSPTTLDDNRKQKTFDRFMIMAINQVDVLKRTETRAMVTFGERRRDPVTTAAPAQVPLAGYFRYGTTQPVVLASTWARSPQAGVLLHNWTHTKDQPDIPGGDQSITVTLDVADLGLSTTSPYFMNVIESGVEGIVQTGPFVLGASYPFSTTVKETTSKFVYFTP